jgi:hypothetical protein
VDVLQIRILASLGSFPYAKRWYQWGHNSPVQRDSENDLFEYYSVGDFAVATSRRNAEPLYSAFVQYHNDPNYADTIVRDALDGLGKWGKNIASIAQRVAVIVETSAFHILFLHAYAQLNDAINACKGESSNGEYELTHPWDEVAALMIGSLEGPNEGGSSDSEDGQLIWSLGNRRAFQFQTLTDSGYAKVNSQVEDLLFAGKGVLDAMDCNNLEKTANSIKKLMVLPLMQSTIRYAIQNEGLSIGSQSQDLPLGEAYALAIIPIIAMVDQASADIIEENMVVRGGAALVRDGAQEVGTAVGAAAMAMGMTCESIGYTSQVDPCTENGGRSSAQILRPLVVSLLVAIGGALLVVL